MRRFDSIVAHDPSPRPLTASKRGSAGTLYPKVGMIKTPLCDRLGIEYPIVLGGMGSGTTPELVSAVSEAGGLGTLGMNARAAEDAAPLMAKVRQGTGKPFGVNFLLFNLDEAAFAATLAERPPVVAFAWAKPEQNLREYFQRAHDAGALVMYQTGSVPEARLALEAGAEVLIAQGAEGGGHVGLMGTLPLVPMMVDAVSPAPVLAAGGIADGRGLVAALALGAQGVLLGTRFLATPESPLHENFKAAILASDGHNTELTNIPDIGRGQLWPGAMARVIRNRFIRRWSGQDSALRAAQAEITRSLAEARKSGDVEEGLLMAGQDAGLIHDIVPAGEIVRRIAGEAEKVLSGLSGMGRG